MTAEPTTYKRVPQELVERAIGQLALHPKNPKDHDIGALSESIGDGFYGAIVILKQPLRVLGVECPEGKQWVLAGHGRIETLLKMGADMTTTLPCIEIDVSPLKAGSILLGDNRTQELGGFIDAKLIEALKGQLDMARALDLDIDDALRGTGYDADDMQAVIDRVNITANTSAADAERKALSKTVASRTLPLDLIFTYVAHGPEHYMAKSAGWKNGVHSGLLSEARLDREFGYPIVFLDNEWRNYDHAHHMRCIRALKPKYATVRDVMTEAQCADAGVPYFPLDEILAFAADARHAGAENVVIIPKYDCLDKIPDGHVLGYSVLSSYGATPLPAEAFKGRAVHLLGGSWKRQLGYLALLGDDVVSIDNNHVTSVARFGQFVRKDGAVENYNSLGLGETTSPRIVCLALSFGFIAQAVHEFTSANADARSAVPDESATVSIPLDTRVNRPDGTVDDQALADTLEAETAR